MEEYIEIIKMYEQADPKMDFLLQFTQNYKRLKEAENKALALLSIVRQSKQLPCCEKCGYYIHPENKKCLRIGCENY